MDWWQALILGLVEGLTEYLWMVAWLNRRGLAVFGWWRLVAAAIVAALLLTGRL